MLFIVRHGRTVANAAGLLQGRVDNPLDDEGQKQAGWIAKALGPVDRVISSPLQRALQTAELLGQIPRIDERWIELDYGEWDSRPVADITPDEWAAWRADPSFSPPGGESLIELDQRVAAACEEIISEAEELRVAVFTHVSPIRDGRPVITAFNETAHLHKGGLG